MGQSLADAAVRGTQSNTIADQKQSLLADGDIDGLLALERSMFGGATMMAKDDADKDDDEDDEESDEESDEDDDEDEDDEEESEEDDPRDVRIQELSAEAKKRRIRARKDRERIEALEAENARLKGKKKDSKDDEESDEDDSALKQENEALKDRLFRSTLRTEFNDILDDPKSKVKFKDRKAAFRLLDLDEIEVDEDGEVDGLKDAIDDLAKSYPFLVETGKKDDEDDKPKRRTGQRTGGTRSSKAANRDALIKKYGMRR